MLSKYTNEIVLTYDGDEAGQNATRRAIPMLEKAGLRVKVLRMQGAKDPDEFLKKFGADRFKLLLEGSENQAEYRLRSLQMKFDLTQDEQKVEYARQAAELIAGFGTPVEREIYGARAAEAAGITADAMTILIRQAYRHRTAAEKKRRERRELELAVARQPVQKELRYTNLRAAMAEEGIIAMLLREPALLDQTKQLQPAHFTVPMFGRVYALLRERWEEEETLSPTLLAQTLSPAEMAHLTALMQKAEGPVSEEALRDYLRIIREEQGRKTEASAEDLLRMQQMLIKNKGYGGT